MKQQQDNNGLHVLLVTNLFPNPEEPLRGIFVAQLAERLRERCRLTVISPLPWVPRIPLLRHFPRHYRLSRVPGTFRMHGMTVYSPRYFAPPKMGALHPLFIILPLLQVLRRLHRERQVDLVNTQWVFPDGIAARVVTALLRLPLVLTAHGCDVNLYSTYLFRRPQIAAALRSAGGVTVVSEAQKKTVLALGVNTGNVRVIPNGISLDRFVIREKTACRRKLGLDERRRLILFVGQLVEVKGFDYLINAVDRMVTGGMTDIRVIAIGDGPLRKRHERKVAALNLLPYIRFAGEKTRAEIGDWFGACDLLCLPSIREGCPNVVLESLASGRPVVAARVGGIPELVGDRSGILFERGDAAALAAALAQALAVSWDPSELRRSVQDYSWDNIAAQYMEQFRKAVRRTTTGDASCAESAG